MTRGASPSVSGLLVLILILILVLVRFLVLDLFRLCGIYLEIAGVVFDKPDGVKGHSFSATGGPDSIDLMLDDIIDRSALIINDPYTRVQFVNY
ncbi:hypothetical protein EYF80_044876 [Liparis tanakae]|uniref:Uncharacterized protein n=1 Tax=Liparis tanakae TaxID=230148 RepID=A0A4Z2FVA2_9TELE|nr:hypothetical protein EYF80_044876 [Liparis tanakae]